MFSMIPQHNVHYKSVSFLSGRKKKQGFRRYNVD
jgi:hypothetical protein